MTTVLDVISFPLHYHFCLFFLFSDGHLAQYALSTRDQLSIDRERRKKKHICSFIHLFRYYTNVEQGRHSLTLVCFVLICATHFCEKKENSCRFSPSLAGFIISTSLLCDIHSFFLILLLDTIGTKNTFSSVFLSDYFRVFKRITNSDMQIRI